MTDEKLRKFISRKTCLIGGRWHTWAPNFQHKNLSINAKSRKITRITVGGFHIWFFCEWMKWFWAYIRPNVAIMGLHSYMIFFPEITRTNLTNFPKMAWLGAWCRTVYVVSYAWPLKHWGQTRNLASDCNPYHALDTQSKRWHQIACTSLS